MKSKLHKTLLEKYGDENYGLFGSTNFKEKMLNKYGDEHYSNREKAKETLLNKYGVDHNFKLFAGSEHSKKIWDEQHDAIIDKREETCNRLYGKSNYVETDEFKEKSEMTQIEHYGSIENAYKIRTSKSKETKLLTYGDANYHNVKQFKETLEKRKNEFQKHNNCVSFKELVSIYGQGWLSLNLPIIYDGRFRYISNEYINIIKKYVEEEHNLKATSKQEKELYDYIKTLTNCRIYKNSKTVISDGNKNYELDIYIPAMKIAIEYNGTYWHNSEHKDKYYHQLKTKLCYEKNIMLIHIYEYEWETNKDVVKEKLFKLFNGYDCSKYGWIKPSEYQNYVLSEPNEIKVGIHTIFNEGNFINK